MSDLKAIDIEEFMGFIEKTTKKAKDMCEIFRIISLKVFGRVYR